MSNPVDNFLEKDAGFLDLLKGIGSKSKDVLEKQILPYALAGGAFAGVAHGVGTGIDALQNKMTKSRDYKAMLTNNPDLRRHDAGRVQMAYNSLRHVSPSMAGDPIISGSFVRDTLDMSPEGPPRIGPQTVKLVAESQRNIAQARKSSPVMDAMTQRGIPMLPPEFKESPPASMSEERFNWDPNLNATTGPMRPHDPAPGGWTPSGRAVKKPL